MSSTKSNDESWKITPPSVKKLDEDLKKADPSFFDTSDIRRKINHRWNDDPEKETDLQIDFWKTRAPK